MRETPFFGDETISRRHFEPGNATFWRRNSFSSSFLCGKLHFLATKPFLVVTFGRKCHFLATRPFLVVIFMRETPFFGDETISRSHFWTGNSIFGDEITSRRHFEPRNATFRRRDHFSSSLLREKSHFLATRPLLVVILSREMPLFGDETTSRRHFCAKNSTFWRRNPFSSSFLHEKLHFLATKPFLVVIFARKTPLFGDETLSRRHFCAKNSIFW